MTRERVGTVAMACVVVFVGVLTVVAAMIAVWLAAYVAHLGWSAA